MLHIPVSVILLLCSPHTYEPIIQMSLLHSYIFKKAFFIGHDKGVDNGHQ